MDINTMICEMGQKARNAASSMACLKPDVKNRALEKMAQALWLQRDRIKAENRKDLEIGKSKGLSSAMMDRLLLNDKRIEGMANAIRKVVSLDDPVGEIFDVKVRPNGLKICRMRCPIGVIGIIFESRPNVTADAACLCIKSGNAVILRGGSEAIHSNSIIAALMSEAGCESGFDESAIQLIPVTDRKAVDAMLKAEKWIDLIIPRGGKSLIEKVTQKSVIPVIKHYSGNCFIYADETCDPEEATEIIVNAKTQRPGVCNALETLLIHEKIAGSLLSKIAPRLLEKGVELRGDDKTCELVKEATKALQEDWDEEYLDLILAIKIVKSVEEAIAFINHHSSHHTDAIVATDHRNAMKFLNSVDSACVFVNCSTRFSDGGEFGMGCEIGISTDKLHARGPMGLRELTTYKFIVFGNGQIRL